MDGTLFDTENLTIPMWTVAGKKFGYNITRESVLKIIGISGEKGREVMLEEYGKDMPFEEIREEFRRLVKKEFDEKGVPKKPGLDFILDRLYAAKIPIALATSTRRATAIDTMKRAGIFDKFAAITGGDEVVNGKPAPDIFLLAAQKMGQDPSVCVGFEDSTAGLRGLRAAGIRSVFIKDIVEPPQEVLDTVWRKYNNLYEAAELFD
jgi:HAD superfamily hydrolase (TIGR01509 family)